MLGFSDPPLSSTPKPIERSILAEKQSLNPACAAILEWLSFPPNQISERHVVSSSFSISLHLCIFASLHLCIRGRGPFLPCGRSDPLPPLRPNPIHSFSRERRWFRGAAAHAARLAQLQSRVVSPGQLDRFYVGAGRSRQPLPHAS